LRAINPDGTILWPEHNSLEQYRDIYESGGSALFKAIWLQDPSGLAGEVFHPEWWQEFATAGQTEQQPSEVRPGHFVTLTAAELLREGLVQAILPDVRRLVSLQAHDLAIKQTETADFYCRANGYGSVQGDLFIHDMRLAKLTDLEALDDMAQAGRRYACRAIGIESNGFQSLMFNMAKRSAGRLPWKELEPAGRDKVIRARPFADHMERRKVYFHYGARWLQAVRYQLLEFPGGAHEDAVDALAYLYEMATRYTPGQFRELAEVQEELRRITHQGGVNELLGLPARR
jgi:predicted phage terminase large subunit-like protein